MSDQQVIALAERLARRIRIVNLKRNAKALAEKLRYPMAAILDKVPGQNFVERAKAIGVSRQTLYVWRTERFRPTGEQAERIAKLTGIPEAHIRADGNGDGDGAGTKVAKAAAKLAQDGGSVSSGPTRARAKRRRVGAEQGVGRSHRKVRRRTDG